MKSLRLTKCKIIIIYLFDIAPNPYNIIACGASQRTELLIVQNQSLKPYNLY